MSAVCAASFVIACSSDHKTTRLVPAENATAAIGEVTTSIGENGNTNMRVKVTFLAPPDKLSPGASTYVVWVKPDAKAAAQNVGALRVKNDRSGELDTKTALTSFDVVITPEAAATVTEPAGAPAMTGRVSST
ncbi:MAG TPA: hypothetical protein VH062_15080 [Polyangiaceae bacterium]|nr:hypothetical protein [Polyangiaceae bacterium]